MTPEQDASWQTINDSWPIATTGLNPDGSATFTCDDGDTGVIWPDGRWEWT